MPQIAVAVTQSTLVVNQTKRYNMSEADLQTLLDTIKASLGPGGGIGPPGSPPPTPPTNEELVLIWIQRWMDDTIHGVRARNTVPPPPITISDA